MTGPFDFTGQNIQDTYQRLVQVSGSSYYDGTGSLLDIGDSDPFPYTGSAVISGSLEVIGDITSSGNVLFDIPGGDGGIRIGNDWGGYQTINWRSNNVGFTLGAGGSLIARVGATGPGGFIIGNITNNQGTSATLDVRGNTVITGSNSLTGNYALKVANSSGTDILAVENDGKVGINTATPSYTMELGNVGAQLAINGSADNSGHIFLKNSAGEYTANAIGTNAYNTTYSTRNSRSHVFYFGGLGNSKLFSMGDNGSGTLIMQPQGFTSAEFRAVTLFQGVSNLAGPTIYSDGNGIYEGVIINRSNRSNGYSPEGRILQVQATGSERFNITREGDTWTMGYMSASTYYGDGSNLEGIETDPFPYTGSAVISGSLEVIGDFIAQLPTSSNDTYFLTYNTASYQLEAREVATLINPKVEYLDLTASISSGASVTLPNGLSYISSSTYEYLEVFFNGLRLRYDRDFVPTSTTTIQTQIAFPSGSELTFKSLKA